METSRTEKTRKSLAERRQRPKSTFDFNKWAKKLGILKEHDLMKERVSGYFASIDPRLKKDR